MNWKHLFTLEHSRLAYRADFALYGTASIALAAFLMIAGPRERHLEIMAFSLLGLTGWPLIEYLLHRFVLHGLRPFSTWHAEHHRRPAALINTPTVLSAALIAVLVFLPGLILGGLWRGCALTFGILTGYLTYSITHHASHHWRANHAWMKQLKHRHALHHSPHMPPGHYGVTSGFWDYVFGSSQR
jgi:sterol desaturase/sphingolipid hydroxylase (fatty acid hydroxylase superfamily)